MPEPTRPRQRRWRTTSTAIAAVALIGIAVYTSTNGAGQSPAPAPAVTLRPAAVNQLDLQGLLQAAQQLPAGSPSSPTLDRQISDLLKQFGIDPSAVQQFLDQIRADISPQQLLTDALRTLTQAGISPGDDLTQFQSALQELQPLDPSQLPSVAAKLLALAVKYWWILPIIIVVAVIVLVITASFGKPNNQDNAKNSPGCGRTAGELNTVLARLLPERITTGTGFAIDPNTVTPEITITSGNLNPDPGTQWDLAQAGAERLRSRIGYTTFKYNDAEAKMATYMRLTSDQLGGPRDTSSRTVVDHMCFVINHPGGPCDLDKPDRGCIFIIPYLLSSTRAQELTVTWKTNTTDDNSWWHIDLASNMSSTTPSPTGP